MKKSIPLTLFILIFLIGMSENNNVKAEEEKNLEKHDIEAYITEIEHDAEDERVIEKENGILIFDTVEGKEAYEDTAKEHGQEYVNNTVEPQSEIPGLPTTLLDSERRNGVFGGYISANWAYSDGYSFSQGESFSFSASQQVFGTSVSVNFTRTNEVAVSIPADASRLNRLGHQADILFERYRQNPPNMSGPHEYTEVTYSNPQLVVFYQ